MTANNKKPNKVHCNKYNSKICKGCHHGVIHKEVLTESEALKYGYCKDCYCTTGNKVKCVRID